MSTSRWPERSLYLAAAVALLAFAHQVLLPSAQARAAVAAFDAPPPDTSLWSPGRIAAYAAHGPQADTMPVVGVVSVPRLGLEAPIHMGATEAVLDRGVGLIPGTAPLGSASNTGLAAHRDGWFRPLKDIAVGDLIRLRTRNGPLDYTVVATEVVSPDSVDVLAPSDHARLTLVTCWPFYFVGEAPSRFIVHAVGATP